MDEMEIVRKKKSNVNKGYLQNVVRSNSSLLSYADKATEVKKRAYRNARNNYVMQVSEKIRKDEKLQSSLKDLERFISGDNSVVKKYSLRSEDSYNQIYGLGKYREIGMRDTSTGLSVNDTHLETYKDYVIRSIAEKAFNGRGLDGIPRGVLIDAVYSVIGNNAGGIAQALIPHSGYDRVVHNINNVVGAGYHGYRYSKNETENGNKFDLPTAVNSAVDLFGTPVRALQIPVEVLAQGYVNGDQEAFNVLRYGKANVIPTNTDNFIDEGSNIVTSAGIGAGASVNAVLRHLDKFDSLPSTFFKTVGKTISKGVAGQGAVNYLEILEPTQFIKNSFAKKVADKVLDKVTGGMNANSVTKNIGKTANDQQISFYQNVYDAYTNPNEFIYKYLPKSVSKRLFEVKPVDDVILFPNAYDFKSEIEKQDKVDYENSRKKALKNKS